MSGLEEQAAAKALAELCEDWGELEQLAFMLRTLPASYGLPVRLVQRLGGVASRLWDEPGAAVE